MRVDHKAVRLNVLTAGFGMGVITRYFGAGAGVEYERFMDRDGLLSLCLPIVAYQGGELATGEFGYGDTRRGTTGYFLAPGLRLHPMGNRRRADLGLGAAIAFGRHGITDRHMDDKGIISERSEEAPLSAILVQAILNLRFRNGFVLGWHMSGGPLLSVGIAEGAMFQMGVRIGGAW